MAPLHLRLLLPVLALGLGVAFGFISPLGLALAGVYIAWILLAEEPLPHWLWWSIGLIGSIALAAHQLPGFSATAFGPAQQFSADAMPVALRLSWDKLLVGLTLLAWWLGRPPEPARQPRLLLVVMPATLVLVPLLAWALGLVGWQVKWPEQLWLWLALNLGVAVLAEELLFRAWLQPVLVRRLGSGPGLLLGAALFGAAHLPFSPLFAVVAALAGLGYGLAFHLSGRLWPALLLHGAVNLLHFVLLSYPLRVASP
ncbi:MAG: type II CAAX endopeptidase family protein [Pseudomonas sp.]